MAVTLSSILRRQSAFVWMAAVGVMVLLEFMLRGVDSFPVLWPAVALTLVAACVDVGEMIVPNQLVIGGSVVGLAYILAERIVAEIALPLAILCLSLALLNFIFANLRGYVAIGMGDLKLLAVCTLFVGWYVFLALYIAAITGATYGVVGQLRGRLTATTKIPFVPFIALGMLSVVVDSRFGLLARYLFGGP